jgi:hypothetical protein
VIRHRWRSHIKNASDEAALLALVRDYLAEWSTVERAELPSHAWPGCIASGSDLTQWASRLTALHEAFNGPVQSLSRLQDLLLFFTHAAVRFTWLANTHADTAAVTDRRTTA